MVSPEKETIGHLSLYINIKPMVIQDYIHSRCYQLM